jgi:hypothetical protein
MTLIWAKFSPGLSSKSAMIINPSKIADELSAYTAIVRITKLYASNQGYYPRWLENR